MNKVLNHWNYILELHSHTINGLSFISKFKSLEKIKLQNEGRVQALGYLSIGQNVYERSEVRACGKLPSPHQSPLHILCKNQMQEYISSFWCLRKESTPRSPNGKEDIVTRGRSEGRLIVFGGHCSSFPQKVQYAG